jgi:hypothetical protein
MDGSDYIYDYNHPRDDAMGGSTEIFHSMEVQMEQLCFGGDFHWNNVSRSNIDHEWDVRCHDVTERRQPCTWSVVSFRAYRYISEGWGGYHFGL